MTDDSTQTAVYGLIGYPLEHSFSQSYFTEKFKRLGINAEYRNFPIADISQLPGIIESTPALRGLNVTHPYKQQVMRYLDATDATASGIGAVNVVCIDRRNGKTTLTGHNADAAGFAGSLRPLLQPHHRRALVLGTGGASRAVVHSLAAMGIEVQGVSRRRADGLLTYADLDAATMESHTLIVNCTPLGMLPHTDTAPDIPYSLLTPRHLLYDLVYNPSETVFLRKGREMGATVKNGLEMLHLQAEASWEFWNSPQKSTAGSAAQTK